MTEPKKKPRLARSLQMRLALGYSIIIAALLILMNTYPLLMTQNLMFRSKETALQKQALLLTNSINTADGLTAEAVEQAIGLLDLDVTRILVTDEAGLVLYDTAKTPSTGGYALPGVIVSSLRGNDAFCCAYKDGAFRSWTTAPVMTRSTVAGAVCLYEEDGDQGMLLKEIQDNLRLISLVVCVAVLALFAGFSNVLARRISRLLGGIRTVRTGKYTHRIPIYGHDELSQLAEEFNQLTLRLQSTEEERRRFVSDASHELKTPLASIRLLADSILQDESIDRGTTREFVADIGEATDRLIHTSEELLALNRLDENRAVERGPVELNETVEKMCRMLRPQAEVARVSLHRALTEGCIARCNEEHAAQIVRNLMENAIKYNVPGGRVIVKTQRQEDGVELVVEDTGVGIPQEELPRVFDRFYRVDKARSREAGGTGLGLSIVKDTLRLHGGKISVERREEAGVRFVVWLPGWTEGEEGK